MMSGTRLFRWLDPGTQWRRSWGEGVDEVVYIGKLWPCTLFLKLGYTEGDIFLSKTSKTPDIKE